MVHYDAARSAEVFIHRAGRTARARASGLSLSIVAPRDDCNHRQTCSVLGLHDGMQAFPMEILLVDRARERVGMALRVSRLVLEYSKSSESVRILVLTIAFCSENFGVCVDEYSQRSFRVVMLVSVYSKIIFRVVLSVILVYSEGSLTAIWLIVGPF